MAAPAAIDRLFLAILPEPALAARIRALADGLFVRQGVDARALAQDRLHATLGFLGDFAGLPTGLVAGVDRALGGNGNACFAAVFDRATSFDGNRPRRPWVITGAGPGMDALRGLHAGIGQRLAAEGIREQGRQPFRPHITLGYAEKPLPACDVDPCVLQVRDVALVRSSIGRGRHEVLGRWPLRAPG